MRRGTAASLSAELGTRQSTAVRFRLRQEFRYDYAGPVSDLVHRLVVVPPLRHGDQELRLGAVQVSDPAAQLEWLTGLDGQRTAVVRLARVPSSLTFSVSVIADRGGVDLPLPVQALADPRLYEPTRLTRPDGDLRRFARELGCGAEVLTTADALCRAVYDRVAYRPGATDVRTTAAQAYALGAGVCQDQAHVLLALCHELGIPSRYVSGHLVGQGGTHAWVEVLVPEADGVRAVALDPCHGRRAGADYLTVATGRDYADVRPTSGWYSGAGTGALVGTRELTREPLPQPRSAHGAFAGTSFVTRPTSPLACL